MRPSHDTLARLAQLVRYYILTATTAAGSGHPSSSLSATDILTTLFFGGFFYTDLKRPQDARNDRLIFSKGHAAPLLYALYTVAGVLSEKELLTLRQFGSPIEGHPMPEFPFTEAATGSLGQGLSVGVGMALHAKKYAEQPYRVYVLLGDSEMAEGSNYEAMALAHTYHLTNLVAIVDVNRLGQRGQTMYGHHLESYVAKAEAFGWEAITVDGHDLMALVEVFERIKQATKPVMIVARTIKGKGISFIENKEGWHGKTLSKEELAQALRELGEVDKKDSGMPLGLTERPYQKNREEQSVESALPSAVLDMAFGAKISTRKAYGAALVQWFPQHPEIVALDAETSNSTFAETFKKAYPDRFLEMFIAEQNMVGTALGLARRGLRPFCSTFAAFFARAADQIRMCQYSAADMVFVGSHVGVSIGEDGPSQMGLEDIALFRTIHGSTVLYPSDAVATKALVGIAAERSGITYLRTTRKDVPVLYDSKEKFKVGGSKTLRTSTKDKVTIVAAGITVHEALAAYDSLKKQGITVRIIDLYSIKPLDAKTLERALAETKAMLVVEDHYPEGGIAEAVRSVFPVYKKPIVSLAVTRLPKSGKPEELLAYEGIDAKGIMKAVKKLV